MPRRVETTDPLAALVPLLLKQMDEENQRQMLELQRQLLETKVSAEQANRESNGTVTYTGASQSFAYSDLGRLVVGNSASAQTFTIEPSSTTDLGEHASLYVMQQGAGQVTVTAGSGVTLIGNGALSQNQMVKLFREGTTETWYVG